jgi:hypothetical protein
MRSIGEWLLEPKLLRKQLDVRIRGSKDYYKGMYEGQIGCIEIYFHPRDVNSSIEILVGLYKTKRKIKLHYLEPATALELPHKLNEMKEYPLDQCIGSRVVVIGPDCAGDSKYVGCYGIVAAVPTQVQSGYACIMIAEKKFAGHNAFFHITSLCSSRQQ